MNIKEFLEKHDNLVLTEGAEFNNREDTLRSIIKMGYDCPLKYGEIGLQFDCLYYEKLDDLDLGYKCVSCKNFNHDHQSCSEVDYDDWSELIGKYHDLYVKFDQEYHIWHNVRVEKFDLDHTRLTKTHNNFEADTITSSEYLDFDLRNKILDKRYLIV